MPDGSLPPSVVRFTRDGGVVGLGVLVGARAIVTCAHVVNLALGRAKLSGDRPDRVDVGIGEHRLAARVDQWTPPPPREGAPGDDIAGLVLDEDAPVPPAKLITTMPGTGQEVRVFGYPGRPVRPHGAWVSAVVRGEVDGGLVQLDSDSAIQVQPGYSGSPVWDGASGRVVGIVATAGRTTADSYAVGADRLRLVWPSALDRRQRRADRGLEHLTIVQPAGPRFGGGDRAHLFGPLHADLDAVGLRPDLVVVAGDLTEHGLRSEFEQAFGWLDELAEAVELPRDRVVVVPGRRDVNRKACHAYFLRMEAEEREPLPPYWAKWEHYAEAFDRFYRDVPVAFTADEPWSLFTVRDLNVVVAGLNSTMADNHVGDAEPDVGDEQRVRFERRLAEFRARSWFRLGVVNQHVPPLGRLDAHLVLNGRLAPGTCSLLRIDRHGVDRLTRLVEDGRWTAGPSTRTDREWPSADLTFAAGDGKATRAPDVARTHQPDQFFERVLEATRVDRPTATVTPNRENRYLRVTERRPGGGVEQWPVFVVDGDVTRAVVDGFHHLHLRFAEQDPLTRSELVHGGQPAAADVVAHGLCLGIRVRSWIDYQGLVDLRALEDRQRRALAEDQVYPAELYVPQRFRELDRRGAGEARENLLDRVVRWLSPDTARFVVVLGDFGRGKSFLLRQLARELPTRLRGVTPVLIELRSLEKAPSLDALLVRHLSNAGVDEINASKLRYMIDSGRVVLLFDGFDELELRVGYDNATDYLRVLLRGLDDRAKVVLTSRTQHFRLTSDVLNVLGEQVTSMSSSRVALLEDFTDDQIRDFLTRHYNGDADRARARFDLLGDVRDLLGLSRNPRMLSFIADLDEERLREVERQEGRISAAELYRELVDFWLLHEAGRQRHERGLPSLDERERLEVCTNLALRLWSTTASAIGESDLGAAAATLARLAERGYTRAHAEHAVGSGTLLVHTEHGFGFVHQSVMEWLVANAAARRLAADGTVGDIADRLMSALMVDFFCDLAGHDSARLWARSAGPGDTAKQNAAAVLSRLGGAGGLDFSGADLRTRDLATFDLRGANLSDADLRGLRLVGVSLAGADLRGADLRGARMVGGDLTGAELDGSNWERAALVAVRGVESQPELAVAAVTGRDPAEVVLGSAGEPRAVAYSPAGDLIAVARGSVVELVASDTHQVLRTLRGHAGPVLDVAFSADGRHIATASDDRTARVWSADGEHTATLRGHTGYVAAVAFSPVQDRIATGSGDQTVRLWTLDGALVGSVVGHHGSVLAVAYSPDGALLATASADHTARVWHADGTARATFTGHRAEVYDIAFIPHSQHLLTGSYDGTARIWHSDGPEVAALNIGHGPVRSVACSPDGTVLATGSDDGVVRTWSAEGKLVTTAHIPRGRVHGLAFTPDGTELISASSDGTVMRRTFAGTGTAELFPSINPVRRLAFSPNGQGLAMLSDYPGMGIWSRDGMVHLGLDHFASTVAYSPNGSLIAASSNDGTTRLWAADGTEVTALPTGLTVVADVAFSPDGRFLATVAHDTAKLWALEGDLVRTFEGHEDAVVAVDFSPLGEFVATASADGTARIWSVPVGKRFEVFRGHHAPLEDVAFSPDRRHLATASADGTAKVWDLAGSRPVELRGHRRAVVAVAYAPDGRYLATASDDGTARLWFGGVQVGTFEGHGGPVSAVAFSPDGTHLATGGQDGTVRLWTVGGSLVATLVATVDGWAALTPDGAYRTGGDVSGFLWWAVKLCRFEAGELDAHYPDIRRLDGPIPGFSP